MVNNRVQDQAAPAPETAWASLYHSITKWLSLSQFLNERRSSVADSLWNDGPQSSVPLVAKKTAGQVFHYRDDRPKLQETQTGVFKMRAAAPAADKVKFLLEEFNLDPKGFMVVIDGMVFMNPRSPTRMIWDVLIAFTIIYFSIAVPIRLSWRDDLPNGCDIAEAVMNVWFAIDMGFCLLTGYEELDGIVYDHRLIIRRYLRSCFISDLLSIIPFEVLVDNSPSVGMIHIFANWKNIAILKMLRLFRVNEIANRVLAKFGHESLRILKIGFCVLTGIHLMTCIWMTLAVHGDQVAGTWLINRYRLQKVYIDIDINTITFSSLYITSVYFSITIVSGNGYGDFFPITLLEKVVTIAFMLLSSMLIAFLISQVSSLFLKIDISDSNFRNKLEVVHSSLKKKRLPQDLIARIQGQYRFYYLQLGVTSFTGYNQILNGLSPALILEVQMFLNKSIISSVPFLNGIGDAFLRNVLRSITSEVWAKGDCILNQGQVGNDMYFIRHGRVEVTNARGRILAVLEAGQFFGELALLLTSRRTATVTALSDCELFCLSKASFDSILKDFPEALQSMKEYATKASYKFERERQGVLKHKWSLLSKPDGLEDSGKTENGIPVHRIGKKYQVTLPGLSPEITPPPQ